jgi:hypothetical protein
MGGAKFPRRTASLAKCPSGSIEESDSSKSTRETPFVNVHERQPAAAMNRRYDIEESKCHFAAWCAHLSTIRLQSSNDPNLIQRVLMHKFILSSVL